MARARNIKPGLYKNETLAECSVWARYLFPGLWMLADREGRLEDRPKRIKGELLPFDSHDVEPLLRELADRGFIERYEVGGERFIQISKFSAHQSPHYSEKHSVIKPPPLPENAGHRVTENSGSPPAINGASLPEDSRKTPGIKRGSQPPDSLIPDSLIPEKASTPISWRTPGGVSDEAWADWLAVRRRKKAATSERAYASTLAKLHAFAARGFDPNGIVATSADNGWTDLYEPKQAPSSRTQPHAAALRSDEI